jgi:hypothetical protein
MREGVDEPRLVVINNAITESAKDGLISTNDVSDGYHTFGELYEKIKHLEEYNKAIIDGKEIIDEVLNKNK